MRPPPAGCCQHRGLVPVGTRRQQGNLHPVRFAPACSSHARNRRSGTVSRPIGLTQRDQAQIFTPVRRAADLRGYRLAADQVVARAYLADLCSWRASDSSGLGVQWQEVRVMAVWPGSLAGHPKWPGAAQSRPSHRAGRSPSLLHRWPPPAPGSPPAGRQAGLAQASGSRRTYNLRFLRPPGRNSPGQRRVPAALSPGGDRSGSVLTLVVTCLRFRVTALGFPPWFRRWSWAGPSTVPAARGP
jgi:hypothetical protein